jgi:RNA polymerase sigma factor (sigma-70 family)
MPKPDATPGHRDSTASSEEARNAFAQHFKQSFAVLWTIAAGIVGDRAMAEDIVQEAALVGLNKFDQFQSGTSFTAWMGQVVRNVALNIARKEQRQRAGAKASR